MELNIVVGGLAGEGIEVAGEILSKVFSRLGYEVFTFRIYPSRIRGGHTSYKIRVSDKRVLSRGDTIDVLVAFDDETFKNYTEDLKEDAIVIYDENLSYKNGYKMPISKKASQIGSLIFKNTVSIGIVSKILGIPKEILYEVVEERFGYKGKKIVEKNKKAIEEGRNLARNLEIFNIKDLKRKRYLMDGSEAIGIGAIAAGCRFFAGYPITPATYLFQFLAENLPDFGGVVLQAEDEISAINMAIGASYAGARAMTATSGPGISLMTEAISFSGMTETPLVIVDAQRPGPATGLPTKFEQGDVNHVVYSGHGDIPRIVISPKDVGDCLYSTVKAFNLAEKYQCPVFLLTDQVLMISKQTISKIDFEKLKIERFIEECEEGNERYKRYKRYSITETGISPRVIPSQGCVFLSTGNEHKEDGHITEDPMIRRKMTEKRMRKIYYAKKELKDEYEFYDGNIDIGILSFLSNYGVIIEVLERFKEKKPKFLNLNVIHPLPDIKWFFEECRKVIVVESNATGQLAGHIVRNIGYIEKVESILKYDGYPFKPKELYSEILKKMGD